MPDQFDRAQAFVDRATALVALGKVDDALDAYEAALAREKEFPNLRTRAHMELPLLVATEAVQSRYGRALAVLDQHCRDLTLPVDHFMWHAAKALMLRDQGARTESAVHARAALDAAARTSSGLRYHPDNGLVADKHEKVVARLRELTAEQPLNK